MLHTAPILCVVVIVLAISKPPGIGPNGTTLPRDADNAYNGTARARAPRNHTLNLVFECLQRSLACTLEKMCDVSSILWPRLDSECILRAVNSRQSQSFRPSNNLQSGPINLFRALPETALRDLDTRLVEEITDTLAPVTKAPQQPASPDRTVSDRIGAAATFASKLPKHAGGIIRSISNVLNGRPSDAASGSGEGLSQEHISMTAAPPAPPVTRMRRPIVLDLQMGRRIDLVLLHRQPSEILLLLRRRAHQSN